MAGDNTPDAVIDDTPVLPGSFEYGSGTDDDQLDLADGFADDASDDTPPADEQADTGGTDDDVPDLPPDATEDPAPQGDDTPGAEDGTEEAEPEGGSAGQETGSYETRYKEAQAWGTKQSQKVKALEAELAELRAMKDGSDQEDGQETRHAETASDQDDYDWDEFNRIAEENGREAALAHMGRHYSAQAEKSVLARLERQQAEQARSGSIQAEALRLFQAAGVEPQTVLPELEALRESEAALGFEPSPGALLALKMGGGNWDSVVKKLAGSDTSATQPKPKTRQPGSPGGSPSRSGRPRTNTGQGGSVNMQDVGL